MKLWTYFVEDVARVFRHFYMNEPFSRSLADVTNIGILPILRRYAAEKKADYFEQQYEQGYIMPDGTMLEGFEGDIYQ